MKIISWNINGIKSIWKKGFKNFVKSYNPDILCIQELKSSTDELKNFEIKPYNFFFKCSERKGYAGVAVYTKLKPKSVKYGIGLKEYDKEGRLITLEFSDFYLVTVYAPNSGNGLVRLKYRAKWDRIFSKYIQRLDKIKPVIVTGDFNVAHTEIDLARPKQNYNKSAGYTQTEIDGFTKLLDNRFIDTFRHFHPDKIAYSYWSYRFNARSKNIGWRIDYFLVSKRLLTKTKASEILAKIKGSDHCPLMLNIKL